MQHDENPLPTFIPEAYMFGKKKRVIQKFPYDPAKQEPVIRASICTGEKVAGFRDREGGTLHEVTLIRDYEDMKAFLSAYDLSEEEVRTIY
jgi:hypothetical protein